MIGARFVSDGYDKATLRAIEIIGDSIQRHLTRPLGTG